MEYAKLVQIYEKLTATTKKLEKKDILAEFIKKVPADLLPEITMLLRGRIFPDWMETELGVAENIMVKTISRVTGINEQGVKGEARRKGDVGLAVEELLKKKKQATLYTSKLTLEKVVANLRKIPGITGSGSIDKKVSLIADLLSNAKPAEGKYIARLVLEEMRIGVGEGLVRDAISIAFDIPVEVVENAHNIRNDFGEVAKIAKKSGKKGLEKLTLKLGRPLKPMLAQKVDTLEKGLEDMGGKAAFEVKYDGMRIQLQKDGPKITVFTRRLDNVTKQFPEIVDNAKKCIKTKNCIIEGEAVAVDPKTRKPVPFQKLSRRIKRKYDIKEMGRELPVEVNLFDIVYLNGKSLVQTPFEQRRKKLETIIKPLKGEFQLAEQLVTSNAKKAHQLYEKALKMGHEGAMIKNLESPYTPGSRVKHMYKVKPEQESLDLVVIGAIWGEGRRVKWLGSYILGARNPETGEFLAVGKVATGLTDADLENLTEVLKPLVVEESVKMVEIKPFLVVEVGYEEIQRSPTYESGFALRFPRVKRIRQDKGPEDSDTVERVSRLFEKQKKA